MKGKYVNQPSKTITIKIPITLLNQLEKYCRQYHYTRSECIRTLPTFGLLGLFIVLFFLGVYFVVKSDKELKDRYLYLGFILIIASLLTLVVFLGLLVNGSSSKVTYVPIIVPITY